MAFDGIVISNLVRDIRDAAVGGRISRITQPESDALLLTIRKEGTQRRLFLSANPSLPLVYLTEKNMQSPQTAPNFCMLLRKYIGNGLIRSVTQPDFERVICIEIEHFDELGDLCRKYLYIELMGKHSNIIFCDSEGMIIDAIRHVSHNMSSVREVLPGRPYFIPQTQGVRKTDPRPVTQEAFLRTMTSSKGPLRRAINRAWNGISPMIASEICERAGADQDLNASALSQDGLLYLYHAFRLLMDDVVNGNFSPCIVYRGDEPVEFSAVDLLQYRDCTIERYDSISHVLRTYYAKRDAISRIRQKSADLRHIVNVDLERCSRKYDLQRKQLQDTGKREKYKVYGELIHTYGYQVQEGETSFAALNYYTNEMITVPLDPTLSLQDNAKKYFERYQKLKRTYEDLIVRTKETQMDLAHLRSVAEALELAENEADLTQIREELEEAGYLRKRTGKGRAKRQVKSSPFHYRSSDGFDIYVGKNNLQNDELTFKVANGGDWWFHAKQMTGSHVIVRTGGAQMTDRAFEEAGALAAYYSAGRASEKVEVDYLQRKNVKKPNGARPGYVIYYTNYSLTAVPDISGLERLG